MMKHALAQILALSLVVPAARGDDGGLPSLQVPFNANYMDKYCGTQGSCKNLLQRIQRYADAINQQTVATTQSTLSMKDAMSANKENLDTKNALQANYGLASKVKDSQAALIQQIQDAYDDIQKQIPTQTQPSSALQRAATTAQGQDILNRKTAAQAAVTDESKVTGFPSADPAKLLGGAQGDPNLFQQQLSATTNSSLKTDVQQAFAAQRGLLFMAQLLDSKRKLQEAQANLQSQMDESVAKQKLLANDTPAPSTSSGGGLLSGLDLGTIASLAPAAVGLASLLKKPASAVTDATSPTPANPIEVSKLDGGASSNGSSTVPAPAPASPANPSSGSPIPVAASSGSSTPDYSDISRGLASTGTASATKPNTTSSSGSGSTGTSSASPSPSPLPVMPVADAKKEEDAMQGINAGGGLAPPAMGASAGSSNAAADLPPPGAIADDSMKDLLNGAADAQPGDGTQASGATTTMGADDLFPRVSACIVRSLKQGRVLNGLGEKIPQ